MAKYQAYPVYQSANSQWIDIIPLEWIRAPLKFLVSDRITDGPHETPNFIDDGIPFLSAEAIKFNKLDFSRKRSYISLQLHEKYSLKCSPQRDDIFMVKSGNTTGAVAIVDTDEVFNIWSPLALIRSNKKIVIPRYVYYSILAEFFQISVQLSWSQGTQPNIGMGVIENLHLTYPTLIVQKKIVSFLDHETTKIDNLIEKQQQLIELLKEKRQAVISHAVTKGLNPDAPMKDSGVEWLGESPKHWLKQKLVNVGDGSRGCFVNGPFGSDLLANELQDDGVPVVYIRDIKPTGYSRKSTVYVTPKKAKQLEVCKLEPSDVIVSKVGDPPGDACVYPFGEPSAIVTQDVIRIRVNTSRFSSMFIAYLLNSDFGRMVVNDISVEGTRKRVSLGDFKATKFVFPPLQEALDIVDYLNGECEKIDSTIAKANRAVALMQERRTALISAAVTGKIDVRNWVAPDAEKAEVSQEATA
ncbi:EcoKI restriction-modification system protein HsdS [Serratia liquefaciens]|uniref:restriction endonuclease subunit S n=1 Tax=Serratia liquefaciens TaxID=614 RepID=UPI00217BA558|nr:restriction endonuclease subunit S [Serratia liquefaciens]CAI1112099.1 EcoKI restriction-modification system protein HsdS [Serratia liquefaciens]